MSMTSSNPIPGDSTFEDEMNNEITEIMQSIAKVRSKFSSYLQQKFQTVERYEESNDKNNITKLLSRYLLDAEDLSLFEMKKNCPKTDLSDYEKTVRAECQVKLNGEEKRGRWGTGMKDDH